jgi:hypothetical protein
MYARTWPGLLLVIAIELALLLPYILVVGAFAWVDDLTETIRYFRDVRREQRPDRPARGRWGRG